MKWFKAMDIPDFSSITVLVVGDVMLDCYWMGDSDCLSPEAPVPVVHKVVEEQRAGGAANTAMNARALGCQVILLGIVGQDANGETLKHLLQQHKVETHFVTDAQMPTITKTRVLSRQQQLLRIDDEQNFSPESAAALAQQYLELLAQVDVVILSDYGKQTLSDPVLLIQAARQQHCLVCVDPKRKDWSAYRGASLLTPNQNEFAQAVGDGNVQWRHQAAKKALRDFDLEAILLTEGASGMTLVTADSAPQHLPAVAREVFDITGAGDTVIAVMAAALAASLSLEQAMRLSNLAASISVTKLGASTVTLQELRLLLRSAGMPGEDLISLTELQQQLGKCRQQQQRIVMTNGCFDILHAGHVDYLAKAKQYGDCLVVALNDDASVARLKGAGRPVNSLAHRAKVLSALAVVDWVIAFSEDSPENLVQALSPDILVKGSDYANQPVAGAEWLQAHGGELKFIEVLAGMSTSQLIQQIKHQ